MNSPELETLKKELHIRIEETADAEVLQSLLDSFYAITFPDDDPRLLESVKRGIEDVRAGRTVSLDEFVKRTSHPHPPVAHGD